MDTMKINNTPYFTTKEGLIKFYKYLSIGGYYDTFILTQQSNKHITLQKIDVDLIKYLKWKTHLKMEQKRNIIFINKLRKSLITIINRKTHGKV